MRITSGIYKGRRLRAPEGLETRPTSDRVREALFNILVHHDWGEAIANPLRGKNVLDGFAGTGALGLEALSRGAAHTTLIEKDRSALNILKQNIALLKCEDNIQLMGADITLLNKAMDTKPCDLIFLDPPYRKELSSPALVALEKNNLIAENALIIIETAKNETLEIPATYAHHLTRTYGSTDIHFYTKSKGPFLHSSKKEPFDSTANCT